MVDFILVVVIADPLRLVVSCRQGLTSATASLLGHLEIHRLTIASLIVIVSIASLMLDSTSPSTATSLKAGFFVHKALFRICEFTVPRSLASASGWLVPASPASPRCLVVLVFLGSVFVLLKMAPRMFLFFFVLHLVRFNWAALGASQGLGLPLQHAFVLSRKARRHVPVGLSESGLIPIRHSLQKKLC